jgi:hypothetical protein
VHVEEVSVVRGANFTGENIPVEWIDGTCDTEELFMPLIPVRAAFQDWDIESNVVWDGRSHVGGIGFRKL